MREIDSVWASADLAIVSYRAEECVNFRLPVTEDGPHRGLLQASGIARAIQGVALPMAKSTCKVGRKCSRGVTVPSIPERCPKIARRSIFEPITGRSDWKVSIAAHLVISPRSEAVRRGWTKVGLPGIKRDVSEKTPFSVSSHTGATTEDEHDPIP